MSYSWKVDMGFLGTYRYSVGGCATNAGGCEVIKAATELTATVKDWSCEACGTDDCNADTKPGATVSSGGGSTGGSTSNANRFAAPALLSVIAFVLSFL